MENEIKTKIAEMLSEKTSVSFATSTKDGNPQVAEMSYVSDGGTVYFFTDKNSRKAKNMETNKNVAYNVNDIPQDPSTLKAIQMEAVAELMTDEAEVTKWTEKYYEKFPMMKSMPKNPDWVMFRIKPKAAYFLDHTKGFGHRDYVEY